MVKEIYKKLDFLLGVATDAWDLSPWRDVGRSGVQGQPWLHREVGAILGSQK